MFNFVVCHTPAAFLNGIEGSVVAETERARTLSNPQRGGKEGEGQQTAPLKRGKTDVGCGYTHDTHVALAWLMRQTAQQ